MAARFSPRARRRFSVVLLIAAFATLHLVMFSPDRLLLFPTTDPLTSIGSHAETVPFRGGKLEVWIGRSRPKAANVQPEVYLLRFYGNADRADQNAGFEASDWKSARAVEIWGVNYPGFGASTGPASLESIGPAALAAFDALKEKAGDRPIIVYGTSIGTTAALHIAARRGFAGLILQNPPPLRQIVLREFGWWNLWLLAGPVAMRIPDSLDSLSNARASRMPCTFLLAGEDEIVRPKYQRLVAEAYAGDKRIIDIPGAHHNDPLDRANQTKLNAAIEWMLAHPAAGR